MRTGNCRHDWIKRTQALSEAFPTHSGELREFRVCTVCLRIEELRPRATAIEFPATQPVETPAVASSSDDRAA